jgi:hypothetical protein
LTLTTSSNDSFSQNPEVAVKIINITSDIIAGNITSDIINNKIGSVKNDSSQLQLQNMTEEYYIQAHDDQDYIHQKDVKIETNDIEIAEKGLAYKMKIELFWKNLSKKQKNIIKVLTCPCVVSFYLPEIIFIILYLIATVEYNKLCTDMSGELSNLAKNCDELNDTKFATIFLILSTLVMRVIQKICELFHRRFSSV